MWKNWVVRWGSVIVVALLLGGAAVGIAGAAGGLHHGRSTGQATPPVSQVAATNPDGHCVMLPSVSDIVKHPEKHPGWHVIGGQCGAPTPGATATPTPAQTTPPVSQVAATNPDGHCVMLPSVSDIVKHPEKHPGWHVIGGQCGAEAPGATGTPTPAQTTPPVSQVAATNPNGHCVMLPSVSDIVKHPKKHPGWHVIGGQCGAPTPGATATPTPSG